MSDCKFCNKFNDLNKNQLSNKVDTILLETSNFIVTPTVGSLVEGWVLIISKSHFISVGELSSSLEGELDYVIDLVKKKLQSEFSQVFVFEHGPCSPLQSTGCGIDHLHVHVVPLNFNLFEKAKLYSPLDWNKVVTIFSSKKYFKKQLPYLFIESAEGRFIATNKHIPHQFFRQIIARELGISDFYDWKLGYGLNNVHRTVDIFSTELQLN